MFGLKGLPLANTSGFHLHAAVTLCFRNVCGHVVQRLLRKTCELY